MSSPETPSSTEDARATGQERRGVGSNLTSDRELYASGARAAGAKRSREGSQSAKPVSDPTPLLLVGDVRGLFPSEVTVTSPGTGKPVQIRVPDWRKLRGFEPLLKAAIGSNLGYQEVAKASMTPVVGNADAVKAMKRIGHRQLIYFGHGGGEGTGIFPAGLDKAPLSEGQISAALPKDAPVPILVACWGSEVRISRSVGSTTAIGTRRTLQVLNWELDVPSAPRRTGGKLGAADLVVKSITLGYGAYDPAPAPLRGHSPTTPP